MFLIFLVTLSNFVIGLGDPGPLLAQVPPRIDPTLRSGKPPILEKEKPRPPTPPPRVLREMARGDPFI